MPKRQIIAMGGGGFSMEPDNPLLDNYILKQCDKDLPKICFIATASGDADGYIERFYTAFSAKQCDPSHLSLFGGHTNQIEEFVLQQDVMYVGGGNTRNMLVLWREWGLDKMLLKAYQNGTILSGLSAGAICWFEEGLTDSVPLELSRLVCLGILEGSNCPHFDGEPKRQAAYESKVESGEMKAGIACDDSVGLHFVNEKLERIIASTQDSFAYRYWVEKEILKREKLTPIRL
ncbi:MAG: Type 1 glutamine amidotransferase-like domain-containing protein [Chitinophagales bacterium]